MPTSSQALIILATDGRLPRHAPRRIFPVSSVPYPVRNHDISQQCMDCYSKEEEDEEPTNVYEAMRKGRVRWNNLADSLPEILKISRFRGTLMYDVESKILKWQVNSESQPHNKRRNDDRAIEDAFGLREDLEKSEIPEDAKMTSYERTVKASNFPSLPMLFKARIDDETYRRLCGLSFRDKRQNSATNIGKGQENQHSRSQNQQAFGAWVTGPNIEDDIAIQENPETLVSYEKIKDKDFRIEDLSLNTKDISSKLKLTHGQGHLQGHPDTLQQYLKERNTFFAKYGNYQPEDVSLPLSQDSNFQQRFKARKLLQSKLTLPDIGSYPLQRKSVESNNNVEEELEDLHKPPEKKSLIDEVKDQSNYKKWKKKRLTSVRLRKEAPPCDPLCVCFTLKDNAMSHEVIKSIVEEQTGTTVLGVQFDPISVHAIDSDARSRWIVKMRDINSRDLIVAIGLIVDDDRVEVRLLDEAIKEEVEAYKLYTMVQKGQVRMPSNENEARVKRRRSRVQVTMAPQLKMMQKCV
ncbi:hypothetical protein FSP39_008794 [Pinctada imbricata]|uniref:Uncharacterized protein n=1 Tax=Pinctada imbricata TaxID=66713 RepID=A0AA88Y3P1_PINIB|nr:hypothetical protein FSP39_008794 [Pinctada imbricata]